MSFQWPYALIGLAVVPGLVALYVRRERRRTDFAARFTAPALLPNLVAAAPGWRRHVPLALLLAALTAMVVGVARPHAEVNVRREQATVILAIDTSLSMRSADVRPTRLESARRAARAFLAHLPKKFRVGVVGFSGRVYVALPPTDDRALARQALVSLQSGQGTSLGDAIALSLQLVRRERASDGSVPPAAILLISDGAQMTGRTSPTAAAARARSANVPVYTVVVGTQDGVITAPLPGGFQAQIRVPPDPSTLRQVALLSHGRFFAAADDSGLRQIYERLGSRLGHRRQSREITDYFARGSAALLFFGGALSALWFRRIP